MVSGMTDDEIKERIKHDPQWLEQNRILLAVRAYRNNMQFDEHLDLVDMRSLKQRKVDYEKGETRRMTWR